MGVREKITTCPYEDVVVGSLKLFHRVFLRVRDGFWKMSGLFSGLRQKFRWKWLQNCERRREAGAGGGVEEVSA